jgi:hypothetical protein
MTTATTAHEVREITDEEVAFYLEHGWVKLDRLVSPDVASEMYKVAASSEPKETGGWASWSVSELAVKGVEPYPLLISETMGRNVQRLFNRKRLNDADIPVIYRGDSVYHREPGAFSFGAPYHQDSAEHGSDRAGELQFWLALQEVTPQMGAMRFVERSHREGLLGSTFNEDGGGDLLALYPKLPETLGLSPEFHYQPGDATVHHGYTVHGSPDNETDRPRVHMLFSYAPADTRYWGGEVANNGSHRIRLSDERKNPIIYPSHT